MRGVRAETGATTEVGAGARLDQTLWAITAYFNPMGYRRRRENFRLFRERLRVPLVAVELGFGGRFDLGDDDAETLVRISGGDVMFQKERLLNLALAHVPVECRHIAWLDSDVVFERNDWMHAAVDALARHSLVQLFGQVDYVRAGWAGPTSDGPEVYLSRQSLASATAAGRDPLAAIHLRVPGSEVPVYSKGFAWAGWRSVLEQAGLYDECILGGGDSALVSAVFGDMESVVHRQEMSQAQEARYGGWARLLRAAGGDAIGLVDGRIFHLWHGDMRSRRHGSRHAGFRRFEFDPAVEIAASRAGAWRWNSPKSAMHAFVANHFALRREDA
jgi:hypothetical protein